MEVMLKNEGGLSANNTGVSIAAKMTNDEKVQAYIEKLETENHDLQQKWLSESYEKSMLKERAKKIIRNLLTLSMPIDYAKCPEPLQKIAEAERFLNE